MDEFLLMRIPRRNYEKGFPTFLSQKKGKVTKNCVRSPNSKVWLLWPKKNLILFSILLMYVKTFSFLLHQ